MAGAVAVVVACSVFSAVAGAAFSFVDDSSRVGNRIEEGLHERTFPSTVTSDYGGKFSAMNVKIDIFQNVVISGYYAESCNAGAADVLFSY